MTDRAILIQNHRGNPHMVRCPMSNRYQHIGKCAECFAYHGVKERLLLCDNGYSTDALERCSIPAVKMGQTKLIEADGIIYVIDMAQWSCGRTRQATEEEQVLYYANMGGQHD